MFDSSVLPEPDRLDAFRHAVATSMVPTEVDSPQPAAFIARLGARPMGTAQITALAYTSVSARRSPRSIRLRDPEYYQAGFIRAGRQGIDQHDTRAVLHAGDLVVWDSSQPFEAVSTSEMSPARSVVLHFPKRLLPLPAGQVKRLCATAIPGTTGIGRLLAQFLVAVADDDTRYGEGDIKRLGHTAVDLTTAVLAHHLERDNPPLRSPSRVLYLRIVSFIDQNLSRPDLDPAGIAAAHQISLRYLHRIFQQHHHTSVNAHVRARRLDRARRALTDPRLDHLAIGSIAARCGFRSPADFGRAFRHHTGISPTECRNSGG